MHEQIDYFNRTFATIKNNKYFANITIQRVYIFINIINSPDSSCYTDQSDFCSPFWAHRMQSREILRKRLKMRLLWAQQYRKLPENWMPLLIAPYYTNLCISFRLIGFILRFYREALYINHNKNELSVIFGILNSLRIATPNSMTVYSSAKMKKKNTKKKNHLLYSFDSFAWTC